jgi:hypothetical protein
MVTFHKKTAFACAVAAASVVLCALPASVERSQTLGIVLSVDQARAEIGRPGTPGSVAGAFGTAIYLVTFGAFSVGAIEKANQVFHPDDRF